MWNSVFKLSRAAVWRLLIAGSVASWVLIILLVAACSRAMAGV